MTYKHVPRIHLSCIESYSPCIKSIQRDRKSLSNSVDISGGARRWFRNLLWMAFPSRSENELANKAASVLGVSPRQIRNWLREDNDASLRYVFAVLAIAGGEIVFKQIEGRD